MYSPFFDSKGNPLSIERIKYHHLEQLADCDEGHHLEYKLLLEDGGKAQLAKEITSFANCEGGWLIVGIDDKTKEIKPIDKKDYSQRIGKIATRISPMPEFSTRFLTIPEDKTKGVLVVYVYEGKNAPYICNGSIYVRSGSSKEPIKSADRGNIEYLYESSNGYKREIENFCKRDLYLPVNDVRHRRITYPIANIYLKNISSKQNRFLNWYTNRDKLIEFVRSKYNIFENISYSMDSIIFMHKTIIPGTYTATYVFELYYDWSCKIIVPIPFINESDKNKVISLLRNLGIAEESIEKIPLTNGFDVFSKLVSGMIVFEGIAKKYHLKEKDFVYSFELENAEQAVACFTSSKFTEYIKQYGLPYAHMDHNKRNTIYLRDYPKVSFVDLRDSMIKNDLGSSFGFRSDNIFEIWTDSYKQVEESDQPKNRI